MNPNILGLLKTVSVLLVEDDDIARAAIKQALKIHCKHYVEASDGIEGLEAFKEYHFDIIITDIHMPGMNGFEMMSEVLKLKPKQLFIIMTSYDTDKNLLNSLEEGACSYLRKPIKIEEIQTALLMNVKQIKYTTLKLNDMLSIDYQNEMIYEDGEAVYLSHKVNKIFWLFCYNLNALVSYEMIEEYVYDTEFINRKTINMAIQRIRQSIKSINIENISNTGYILRTT
jgi:DNA-binding response OmpR family regulator